MSEPMTPRQKYEAEKYEESYCSKCGKKRCPPEMDICPICHPEADYDE